MILDLFSTYESAQIIAMICVAAICIVSIAFFAISRRQKRADNMRILEHVWEEEARRASEKGRAITYDSSRPNSPED